MALSPNQQLFEYRIQSVLGRGAFGTVCLAHDTVLDRPVAIKELTLSEHAEESDAKRFLQEARTAGGLNHLNIVTVYALRDRGSEVYLVMEYLAGGSLRTLLKEGGALPVERAVQIAADVCDGLAAAHAKGIVHRDIKPENILLTPDGRAKVGDFGIAHMPRAIGGYGITQTGFQPGTLTHMSPEQIRGHPVDGRSDVYQVGILLYEMLTGQHHLDVGSLQRRAREIAGSNVMLFQARLHELLAEEICARAPRWICDVRRDVPEWIGYLVAAAASPAVEARPTTAGLARALVRRSEPPLHPSRGTGESDPALAAEFIRRGVNLGSQGHFEAAVGEFEAALRISPGLAEAHHHLAVAHQAHGRWDQAIQEFASLIRIAPSAADARLAIGDLYLRIGWPDEALGEFQSVLQVNPRDLAARMNLGIAYGEKGEPAKAIVEFRTVLRADPAVAEVHMNLGIAYSLQACWNEAICSYRAALAINPNLAHVHRYLGSIYLDLGQLDDANREFQAALRIDPNQAQAHLGLGHVFAAQRQWDDAIRGFRAAVRIDPGLVAAFGHLGMCLRGEGDWEGSAAAFEAALRLEPNRPADRYFLACTYRELGRDFEAIEQLETALHQYPDYDDALICLGQIYIGQRRFDEAISRFKAARVIDPSSPVPHRHLCIVYSEDGQLDKAMAEARLALQHGDEDAHYLIADVERRRRGLSQ